MVPDETQMAQIPVFSSFITFLEKYLPPDLNSCLLLAVSDVMMILIGQNKSHEFCDTLVYECVCV